MDDKKYSYYEISGDKFNYEWALEMAGLTVLYFEEYGSYQGNWLAKVKNGEEVGYIFDSYGSCSGCDHFKSNIDYKDRTIKEWQKWCKNFIKSYLPLKTLDEVIGEVKEDIEWDTDARECFEFLKKEKENE